MTHSHHHDHHAPPGNLTPAFAIGVGLNAAFVVIEAASGFFSSSLALLADAGHNLSDVLGLLLAWGAVYLSRRQPTPHRTYGLRRSSIMAALINGVILYIAVGAIAWEAIGRLLHPETVKPLAMIVVAGIGVVINTITAMLFMAGREHDLNVRAAFLHMAADAAVSLGVVIGGAAIGITGWLWLDPALSLLIAAVSAYSTWDVLWHALELALDSVPRGINPDEVRAYFAGLPGVTEIHDLHIWGMSTTETALTVHLVRPGAAIDDDWLHEVAHELHERFGIVHPTIQIESGEGHHGCHLAPDEVV